MKTHQIITASLILLLLNQNAWSQRDEQYAIQIMNGISNKGLHKNEPYITPGDKAYIVGTQDGNFPDLGSHVEGEMGGLWMQPVKLLDGFWLRIFEAGKAPEWLTDAREFINYPYGNRFVYAPVLSSIEAQRFQFCPQGKEGMVVQYQLKNTSAQTRKLQLEFTAKTDLSPVWFSKENGIADGEDSVHWLNDKNIFTANDNSNPWFAVWGSSLPAVSYNVNAATPVETKGMGKAASATYQVVINAKQTVTVTFVVSGSNKDQQTAERNYEDILKTYPSLLTTKKQYYNTIIRRAQITIPDKNLQQAYTWGKINTEWLVNDVSGIGRFLSAGAIEYPWLFGCDNSYALQGVVATGDFELAKSTLRLIENMSEKVNGNGRIIHEMSTNGFVGNKGNTQETPHFALAVWKVFEWTGDKEFLRDMYPYIRKGINWLLTEQDQNKDGYPEGYGIMEVKGLNAELIDVAVYTEQDLEVASKMAALFGEPALQKEYAEKAAILKDKINRQFWDNEEGTYCDFYGTSAQALSVAKGALEQLYIDTHNAKDSAQAGEKKHFYENLIRRDSSLPADSSCGWFTNKNWVISTPAETGIAPRDKAIRLLNKVRNENCGEYGPYLSAVERRYMMTIATSVQAVSECSYNRTDEALWYVDKIVKTFGHVLPGSISEMMPDYGCPAQAWTMYGLAVPLITHVFGIVPDAYHKSVSITPHLPGKWDSIRMDDLPVGNNPVSLSVQKNKNGFVYSITSGSPDWKYTLHIQGLTGKKYRLNGKEVTSASDDIIVTGKINKIEADL